MLSDKAKSAISRDAGMSLMSAMVFLEDLQLSLAAVPLLSHGLLLSVDLVLHGPLLLETLLGPNCNSMTPLKPLSFIWDVEFLA